MRFPYGLADFQSLREEDYLYIDRTDRIRTIEQAGKQLLLLRPRRFGKSLWLSTLENYYDLAKADRFERLFGPLAIGRDPTPRRGSYFVMKWNFSLVDPQGDAEAIRRALHQHVNVQIQATVAKYRSWLPGAVSVLPDNAIASFQSLLAAVSLTPHKLYLLVDEYDNFANEVLVSHQHGASRYRELVSGEGTIKTLFKAVKDAAEGRGLDRVFMTGVSPVVLADITSGYNVVKNISLEPAYADLCGFREAEIRAVLEPAVAACGLPAGRTDEALDLMRTFYNGYDFTLEADHGRIYNPTLALYFLEHLVNRGRYPEEMLDDNLAMDRNRIEYVARLPHGPALVTAAVNPQQPITVDRLARRFGVEEMLRAPRDHGFLAALLYWLGVLTFAGRNEYGQLCLAIPNLVVRRLYVERIQEALLPDYEANEERLAVARRFHATGELAPLGEFIERRLLPVFDNRDLRWSNELVVKTLFLATLFDDLSYVMDSETAIDKGYADLSLILRPDRRRYALLDHLLEFKHLKRGDLPELDSEALVRLPRAELRALPAVAALLEEAQAQLARYRETLDRVYGERLRLRTHAVVCVGLARLVW